MVTTHATRPAQEVRGQALRTGAMVSAYRVEQLLGTGGMGRVYRARHVVDGSVVALKVLREDQLSQERGVDRMMREAQILATVPHGGIPRLHECGLLRDGRPWIAMELIAGTSLSSRLACGPLGHGEVIQLVAQVADVLAAAHARGVTHRDLKPDNILLVPDGDGVAVRVIDWGIAHHHAGARYTRHDEAIGTPTYMAPEQARGGPTDGRCDVYGLGVVAYQALTGRPPFSGATAVEILVQHLSKPLPALAPRCPEAPYGLVELVERMLDKRHDQRPCAAEVRDALHQLRDRSAMPAYMVLPVEGTEPVARVELELEPPTTRLRADLD